LQWARSPSQQLALRAAVAAIGAVFLLEGLGVALKDVRDARDAPSYAAAGDQVAAIVPAGSVVLGDNRMWPALDSRDLQLRSLLLLFYHTNPVISRERVTDIPGAFARIDPGYILLSPLSRDILSRLSPEDTRAFDDFMEQRTTKLGSVEARGYGPIDVYEVR
jgi:hypothetical protein